MSDRDKQRRYAQFHTGWEYFEAMCRKDLEIDVDLEPFERWYPRWRIFLAGWCALADAHQWGVVVRAPVADEYAPITNDGN